MIPFVDTGTKRAFSDSPTQLCMKRGFHQSHRQGKPTCSSTLPSQQLLLVFFFFFVINDRREGRINFLENCVRHNHNFKGDSRDDYVYISNFENQYDNFVCKRGFGFL